MASEGVRKLAGVGDLDRVATARTHAPRARLIVDANEAWSLADYEKLSPELVRLGVEMLEQPFPAGAEEWLAKAPNHCRSAPTNRATIPVASTG